MRILNLINSLMNDGYSHYRYPTPNKYNYLALRNLLCPCVLPHHFEWELKDAAMSELQAAYSHFLSKKDKDKATGRQACKPEWKQLKITLWLVQSALRAFFENMSMEEWLLHTLNELILLENVSSSTYLTLLIYEYKTNA